jgi:hypothetical protein
LPFCLQFPYFSLIFDLFLPLTFVFLEELIKFWYF